MAVGSWPIVGAGLTGTRGLRSLLLNALPMKGGWVFKVKFHTWEELPVKSGGLTTRYDEDCRLWPHDPDDSKPKH